MSEKTYKRGAVKQNPETKTVAVHRDGGTWGVMHPDHGGHWASTAELADWVDVPGAPVPDPVPVAPEGDA